MKSDEKRFLLQYTKNTIKICTSIQNFNNTKNPKNGEFDNSQKFLVVFVKNHKALVVKMYKKDIQIKVFLCKVQKFSKN